MAFYHPLNDYCTQLIRAFDQIQPDRRESLKELIDYIQEKIGQEEVVKLNFICTHNSRRSQFGQVWAKLAGIYFKIPEVQTYSGGTEVTAAIRALLPLYNGQVCRLKRNITEMKL